MLVHFPENGQAVAADQAELGAKGAALVRLAAAGLPVPGGVILPVSFFASWFASIRASPVWTRLAEAQPADSFRLCEEVKQLVPGLPWTGAQRQALALLRRHLETSAAGGARFAVRSSSPEEDQTTASFAGAYETRLGVRPDALEEAVRACFASCLDARVLTYKRAHGLDLWSPRMAVIVQRQIDAHVAGVAFSIDPTTNDYDLAAVDAAWGLGTSVVDGRTTPDHFVVDKLEGRVLEAFLGAKRHSTWLAPEGGTIEREGFRCGERTLNDDRLREVIQMVCRVEDLFGRPVDVEWACAGERLHLLQARPITAWVPLPPEMLTRPGDRRLLYGDAALSKGLTMNEPISPMGLDTMDVLFSAVIESRVGALERNVDPRQALFFFAGGRMYSNISHLLWLSGPKALARQAAPTDALMAAILAGVDRERYRSVRRPPWLGLPLLWLVPRTLWRMRRFFWNTLRLVAFPDRARRDLQPRIDAFERSLHERRADGGSSEDFLRAGADRMASVLFDVLMPMVLVGLVPPGPVAGRKGDAPALAAKLRAGIPGDVVVQMGIELFRLARLLAKTGVVDPPRLVERLQRRELPTDILVAWDSFLSTYGWRGPLEMDLARPRYADDPSLAVRQLLHMATDDPDVDPEAGQRRQMDDRRHAYAELMRRAGPPRRAMLRRVYRIIDLFAGTRDTPKHLLALFTHEVRRRALAEGRRLAGAGRLDAPEHVFDLRLADLRAALEDPSLDLRQLREERTRFLEQLTASVRWFPPVIDSRGRILRPPPGDEAPGTMRGTPVSPGRATGPVKVLHTPHDRPVEKGDILVAYTTDPGWTPLFVNAAAIVLEVGGVLQHGAVVAREYGKPCVVGIDRVVSSLADGDTVEVDGTAGTVRVVRRVNPQVAAPEPSGAS
jgi:pyruvate,water dikinase